MMVEIFTSRIASDGVVLVATWS